MAEVIDLITGEQYSPQRHFPNTLVLDRTAFIHERYRSLGAKPTHLAISELHVRDLSLVKAPNGTQESYLTVEKCDGFEEFTRFAAVSETQLRKRAWIVNDSIDGAHTKDIVMKLSLEWILFELCADALGNSVDMQHLFGRYVPDFNGQHPAYLSHQKISEEFLRSKDVDHSADDVRVDHLAFRAGMSLHLLRDSMLRLQLVDKVKTADWAVVSIKNRMEKLSNGTTIRPLDEDGIIERIESVTTRDTTGEMERYLGSVLLPEVDLDDYDDDWVHNL